MKRKELVAVSIFSGAGGLDLGFRKAGFRIAYATDSWKPACDTLDKNNAAETIQCKDIRDVDFREVKSGLGISDVDCLIGGPPCPPFSKSRFYLTHKKRALEDENSYTIANFLRAVQELKPKTFFFENVPGFMYKPHIEALRYLETRSKELGYNTYWKVINAASYGVPQIRERFICVGVRKELPVFEFPRETHYDPEKTTPQRSKGMKPWVTCKDVMGDIDYDLPEDKKMQAGSKHKDLLKKIPPGENYLYLTEKRGHPKPEFKWRSRYWSFLLKLSPDKPSWTIQASHSNNMGPFHWKNRFLRIAEIKRLQTFDDDYEIIGDYRTQWRQVGNAVPPLLAKVIAEAIMEQIFYKPKRPTLFAFSDSG